MSLIERCGEGVLAKISNFVEIIASLNYLSLLRMAAKTVSENSMFDEKKDTNSLKTYSEKCHKIYGVSYCISLFLLHDFLTVVQHLSRHICKYTRNNTTPISNKMLRLLDSNTGQIRLLDK
jgi:hypothetical protein